MKAIDKVMEHESRNNSANWIQVLIGNSRVTIDPSKYCVKASTLQKQANSEGFKTTTWGDEIQLYR